MRPLRVMLPLALLVTSCGRDASGPPRDTTGPILLAVALKPETDPQTGGDVLSVEVSARDSSGVSAVRITAAPPAGADLSCEAELASGTAENGVWRCSVPLALIAGDWRLRALTLMDAADNVRIIAAAELGAHVFTVRPEQTGPTWSALPAAPMSPDRQRHDDVFFISRTTGWVVNTRGEIHGTNDGGATWRQLEYQQGVLFRSVGFASATRGWAGNLNGFNTPTPQRSLYETVDGGETWTNISARVTGPEPIGICGIWVQDAQTIFAVGRWHGPAIFVRSLDGGATWRSFDLRPLATGLVDVYFWDRQRGIIVGGRGIGSTLEQQRASRTVILMTEDAGETWTERYLSPTPGTNAWKISFPTRDTGYVAVQGAAYSGTVLKTVDGGLSWRELKVSDEEGFSGIGFVTANHGWAAGIRGTYETTDGGATWTLRSDAGSSINRIRFLEPGLGYAAGATVYRWGTRRLADW